MSASTIRRVATEVFARQGYHGASLRQIAKASEITLGTLYHYYPSKQDLLAQLMSDALTRHAIQQQHHYRPLPKREPLQHLWRQTFLADGMQP